MALALYRRHRRDCKAGHPEESWTSEYDERKKGWKRCECPIFLSGTLHGCFKRHNSGQWEWESAKALPDNSKLLMAEKSAHHRSRRTVQDTRFHQAIAWSIPQHLNTGMATRSADLTLNPEAPVTYKSTTSRIVLKDPVSAVFVASGIKIWPLPGQNTAG